MLYFHAFFQINMLKLKPVKKIKSVRCEKEQLKAQTKVVSKLLSLIY